MPNLKPLGPREAMELFLEDCRGELSPNTVRARKYRVSYFVRWCEGEDNDDDPRIRNLNDISGRDLLRFKQWRSEDINTVTLRTNLSDIRQFMKFCVEIDAVPASIPEKVGVPVLEHGDNVREAFMDADQAGAIRAYLRRFEYASLDHVLFMLLWETGARMSGLHSLDVHDVDASEELLTFRHRPNQGTRLKNGDNGERTVALKPDTMDTVVDYIETNRTDVTDRYDREPLFSSVHGRMNKRHLSKHVYRTVNPCEYGQECPSGKDPSDCEYTDSYDKSLECPHTTRPHDIRRGSITEWLRNDVPERVVSDRMDVSEQTLDKHYDERSEHEKAELRRKFLDRV